MTRDQRSRPDRLGDGWLTIDTGQAKREGCSLAEIAIDPDFASRLSGKSEHLAQSQPGAFSYFLGREKGLEDVGQRVCRDAAAAIGDRHGDIISIDLRVITRQSNPRFHADRERALSVHCIAAVYGKIDQCRVELAPVRVDVAFIVGKFGHDASLRAAQRLNYITDTGNTMSDIEHFGVERLTARKRQQLTGELDCPIGRIGHRSHVPFAAALGHAGTAEQIDRRAGHRQQVVEIMRNAASQLANGLHFLRLMQRVLGFDLKLNRQRDALLQCRVRILQRCARANRRCDVVPPSENAGYLPGVAADRLINENRQIDPRFHQPI